MLLTSVLVTSVFSVALTSKTSDVRNDRKVIAAEAARRVTSQLRNYVSGDKTLGGWAAGPGNNTWGMAYDGVTHTPPAGCAPAGYALCTGSHTLSGLAIMPVELSASPYNGVLTYHVDNSIMVGGQPVPAVTVNVTWTEL